MLISALIWGRRERDVKGTAALPARPPRARIDTSGAPSTRRVGWRPGGETSRLAASTEGRRGPPRTAVCDERVDSGLSPAGAPDDGLPTGTAADAEDSPPEAS